MKFNNIRISIFLTCINSTQGVIGLQNSDTWFNIWDISSGSKLQSLNYKNFFQRLSSPLTIVFNLECNTSEAILKKISSEKIFHYERYWLLFINNLDLLLYQSINTDTEIYLAMNETLNLTKRIILKF